MHISSVSCVCVCVCVCVFVHVIYCFKYSQVIVGESVCVHYSSIEMCAVDKGGVCGV